MSQSENDAVCCACTGQAVARVLDGVYRKPVCASHRRLYSEIGYLIDALRVVPAAAQAADHDVPCAAVENTGDHLWTLSGECTYCPATHWMRDNPPRVIPPEASDR